MAYPYKKNVDVEIYQGCCHPPARFIPLILDCLESKWNQTIFQVSSFFLILFTENAEYKDENTNFKYEFRYRFFCFLKNKIYIFENL